MSDFQFKWCLHERFDTDLLPEKVLTGTEIQKTISLRNRYIFHITKNLKSYGDLVRTIARGTDVAAWDARVGNLSICMRYTAPLCELIVNNY